MSNMKNKKIPHDRKILKTNCQIVETKAKSDAPNTHIHDRSLYWPDTVTSIKSYFRTSDQLLIQ
jgi:hypothetical protein